jgi:hypothetical protein
VVRSTICQSLTRHLSFFNSPRFRFDSRIFFFSAVGRGDLRRRSFSRAAICARRAARCRSSIASSKRSRASLRFIACKRESCTVTLTPLGRCRNVTAVETLFTFCPPGPPERAKISSRSTSRIPRRAIRSAIESRCMLAEITSFAPNRQLAYCAETRRPGVLPAKIAFRLR